MSTVPFQLQVGWRALQQRLIGPAADGCLVSNQIASVELQDESGRIVSGQLYCSTQPPWRMSLLVADIVNLQCQERDLFECMVVLRQHLSKQRWLLLCNGARTDVYPSGMSREMSGGMMAYRHQLGIKPTRDDLVSILDYAPPESIGTPEEQRQYRTSWMQSLT